MIFMCKRLILFPKESDIFVKLHDLVAVLFVVETHAIEAVYVVHLLVLKR